MLAPPPLRFPEPVRRDLKAHRPGLADETERAFLAEARPCVAVTARRVSSAPLRRGAIARLFGATTGEPVLGLLESKFGGLPYCESAESWDDHSFLGQIDLACATAVLPDEAPRLGGILRMDLARHSAANRFPLRVRWFAEPAAERAIRIAPASTGSWETKLAFHLSWTLPEGNALEAMWPLSEPMWFEYDEFHPVGYNEDGSDEFHRMLGHKSSGLDEPYASKGGPPSHDDHELLLRLTYDNEADFAWGTNCVYLLVPREDLARGDLSRVVVTAANA